MRKEQLEQYRDLRRSIQYEQKRLAKERQRKHVEVDTVTGSNPHFPYEKRVISVRAEVPSNREKLIVQALERKLEKEAQQMEEILHWIERLPTCRERNIFFWLYIEGYTLEKIGRILHYSPSMVRKIRDGVLERME